jgi:hypothetical protein
MLCNDVFSTSQRVKTPAGFLLVPGAFSRTGIHEYRAGQIGMDDRPATDIVRVYRPPEEVFSPDSMMTFGRVPVTNDHPGGSGEVTIDNVGSLAVGMSDPEVTRDGDFMRGTLLITDARAIRDIDSGKRQLSNGYHATFDIGAGVTPAGEPYDAIQRDIKGNHIAIVQNGRGGVAVAIADRGEVTMTKITIDGKEFEVDQVVADAIAKAKADTEAALKLASDAEEEKTEDMEEEEKAEDEDDTEAASDEDEKTEDEDEEKAEDEDDTTQDAALRKSLDKAIAARDAALEQVPTADQLDALADARASVLSESRRLVSDIETSGKSNAEIRRAVVEIKVGDTAGKSDDYVEGRFDLLAAGGGESGRFAARNLSNVSDASDEQVGKVARIKHISDTANAWDTSEKAAS